MSVSVKSAVRYGSDTVLVEGLEITVRSVGTRRVTDGLDELHYDHRWVDAGRVMELVCNVYGADYLPCRASLIEDQGYDHAAHDLAPSAGTGLA
jgi:hypothetical protein